MRTLHSMNIEKTDRPLQILVTGGAGYLGSVMVPHLLAKGHRVRVLDSLIYKQTSLLHLFINPRFEFIEGDVRDADRVKDALKGVDIIINLAALVGAPLCKAREAEARAVNLEAALLLDELRSPQQGYIYPNTTSGYGTKRPVEGLCTEDTPLEPISVYGETKVGAEQALLQKKNVVTYRFTTVFGLSPRLRLDLMPNDFTWKALRQGALIIFEPDFQRSFIHITDIARCIAYTIDNFDEMKGQPYNVGHERMNKSKRDLAEKVSELTGCYVHYNDIREDPDKRNYFVSFKRIQQAGFEPKIGWDDGLLALRNGLSTLHWDTPFANVEYY
jgi:nucleoside-diphosphate-sugar epimerase